LIDRTAIPDGLRRRPIQNLDGLKKNFWIPGALTMLAPRNDKLNKSPGSLRGFF
jgi:hypothetical protein